MYLYCTSLQNGEKGLYIIHVIYAYQKIIIKYYQNCVISTLSTERALSTFIRWHLLTLATWQGNFSS